MMRSQRIIRNICSAVIPSLRRRVIEHAPAASIAASLSQPVRYATSSSSKRWLERQRNDYAAKQAELKGLRSRAGIKLEEINMKHNIFQSGQTVVDLGYAPGSWTQVAVEKTAPYGRVLGVDIIPALPPKGASTMQGNFTDLRVQAEMKRFLANPRRGRLLRPQVTTEEEGAVKGEVEVASQTYIEQERAMMKDEEEWAAKAGDTEGGENSVDVVLSDMLMATSGHTLRDQVGSIKLCNSALAFSIDVLKPGGSFVCKFYMGGDSKLLMEKFKQVYNKVSITKPKSSRSGSKEVYLVALEKKEKVNKKKVMLMEPTD
ncbi:uncharacterized protein LAJ45_04000 [Morchella importuna]|uniref:uncharacterized protein n=1 Tax=Morchella importuna TaxID=1174673 RepID=UPI001E8ECF42|nr:uncharacterized protein LAJ45_04000 [Morchella importuna]KAH8152007.1 hypothetical protein LAJ45_04000 [Morchella importuna]